MVILPIHTTSLATVSLTIGQELCKGCEMVTELPTNPYGKDDLVLTIFGPTRYLEAKEMESSVKVNDESRQRPAAFSVSDQMELF